MAKKAEKVSAEEVRANSDLIAVIGRQVLGCLGSPRNLYQIQVRHLWGNHYRANVLIGADAASASVAHSYFLITDGDGKISTSTPGITRVY